MAVGQPELALAPALAPLLAGLSVGTLFRDQARLLRDRVALVDDARSVSYAALNDRVNRLAHALVARGIGRGDRLAVLSENRIEYVELELAAAKLGAVVACQNWRQSDPELAYCIGLAAPQLALVSERFADTFTRAAGGSAPTLAFGGAYEAALAAAPATEPPELAEPEDPFIILYTSGTTGYPKAAAISQRAMIARAIIAATDGAVFPDATFIAWAPMFHMSGTEFTLANLLHRGKVIVRNGFDADAMIEIIAREPIGYLQFVPGVIQAFIDRFKASGVRPHPIRALGAMADLVPRHLLAEITTLLQAPYRNTFGSTETGQPPAARALIPIGVVPERLSKLQSSYCRVRLVDEDDRDVPDGTPGEVAIRGPSLFSGYWGAPEATAEACRGGWYHMGDVFVRNPDGSFDFVDRRKYLIKSGGENIYPAEIERVLLASPRIADVVVVRRPDARWGEVPVAFVAPNDPTLTAADVLALCDGKIARYKLPKDVKLIAAADLPRSTTGKIIRRDLEALLENEPTGPRS